MSPLLFLAIPVVVFVIGSFVLWIGSRFNHHDSMLRKAPQDLRIVAPMVRDQREAGWPVGSGGRDLRG